MKKTLIASAIAAATFSGSALAQMDMSASELAAKMDSMPQVYGNIQLVVAHSDVENGESELGHYDNGSTIGVKHDHVLAPGITGFFKAELEFDADQKAGNGGLNAFDEAYIGVRGDSFGQIWVGSDDSTYESAIDEIANYYEYASLNLSNDNYYDTGEGDLIQYSSPSFGGLQLHGAVQVNGDGDNNGEKSYPYQLAATYAVDAFELAVAMDSNDGDFAYSSDTDLSVNNENTYGVRGSYTAGDLRVTAQYQTRKDVGDVWGLFGGYSMGANTFALSYEFAEADNTNAETSTITAQALHNLSDNMYVYVEGYLNNADSGAADVDTTDLAIGGVYYF
ncbi:Outer membrane protein (porin) [Marinobacter gudaonensis]|uniref:Outer membrane protein (Porin) n=1 Tax=Marinobacter gudaonensis TaxID=375760 RepID=A0A1I6I0I1_9GAMM|nr:porin [Marinobacter gudaonensis]SFR60236.1 Outer membrane protein (porin) [Marinobacter gudaonensis]